MLTPTNWAHGATLADAPQIINGLFQMVRNISTSKPKVTDSHSPTISTAHEIRSPTPEDYHYSGGAERLLHVWDPRRLSAKPPRTRQSIYAAATISENHGRILNFRARTSTASSRAPHWSKTVHTDLLKRQGLEGAKRYLAEMKADYDHTTKYGPSDRHEVGASHYASRGQIWKQFIAERESRPNTASSLLTRTALRWGSAPGPVMSDPTLGTHPPVGRRARAGPEPGPGLVTLLA